MRLAEVVVFRGVSSTYTYSIPDELDIEPGSFVTIPLGKQVIEGVVLSVQDTSQIPAFIRPIEGKSDKRLPLNQHLLSLIPWLQSTYLLTPFKAFQLLGVPEKTNWPLPKNVDSTVDLHRPDLSSEQEKAFAELSKVSTGTHLLFGVTGSGKTEVYMRLVQQKLSEGKQILMLVPEISLTPQMIRVFESRFGSQVAVIHSGLTPKKRGLSWAKVNSGEPCVLIGPRSCAFAPFRHLGLILIDEEHEPSYKQDQHPRYHVSEITTFLSAHFNCPVVLGSATPSAETYYHTQNHQHLLSQRINQNPLPPVEIVDLTEPGIFSESFCLSTPLQTAIQSCIDQNLKVILFQNRRGYAPTIICKHCHRVHACPTCGLSYTYHHDKTFRCHRCSTITSVTHFCTVCKRQALAFEGTGTQKIEIEIQKLFPHLSLIRLDKDSAKTAKQIEEKLQTFYQSGQILIGTQMIAKGLHFEDIGLVGILGIDSTLHIPDFTSCERAFQLICQVAGRSGRGQTPGRVILQTRNPNHYAIQYGASQDTKGFLVEELRHREALWYPPFCELIHIIFSGLNTHEVKQTAISFDQELTQFVAPFQTEIQHLHAQVAPVEKIKNHYRWQLILKLPKARVEEVKTFLSHYQSPKSVRVIFDFSPRSLL